jgi:hypothetical protein
MAGDRHPEIGPTQTNIVGCPPARKEWRRPGLRRLPVAATAGSGKATINGDDGGGNGKGDVSAFIS